MPTNEDPKMTWCGRPVREMSRDELIEALEALGRLYNKSLEDNISAHRATTDMMKVAVQARYGRGH